MPSGSCACGAIQYQYDAQPATTALCHCRDCQKWTGSTGSANIAIPKTALKITAGEPKSWVRKGDSGKLHTHYFCSNCGSGVYSDMELLEGLYLIKSGTLDNAAGDNIPIATEFFIRSRPAYEKAVDGAQQLQTMA